MNPTVTANRANRYAEDAKSPLQTVTLHRVYRYRIYPTRRAQQEKLERHLELCRRLYNKALWWRQGAWERQKKRVSPKEQRLALTPLKHEMDEHREFSPGTLEDVVKRVDLAYQSFFRRVGSGGEAPGYPKHHPPGNYHSLRVPRSREFVLEHAGADRFGFLFFRSFGLGRRGGDPIAVRMHRELPEGVAVRRVEIKHEPSGHWYACFGWDAEVVPTPSDGAGQKTIALHPALRHYLTTDAGEWIDAPSAFSSHARQLAKAQRRMAKKQRGSYRYIQEKQIVAGHHAKIRDTRRAFLHNLSGRIVDDYDRIYINSFDIRRMLSDEELKHLNLRVADTAWGELCFTLSYKAQEQGKVYVEVESEDTAQECSGCSEIVHKTLKEREHVCPGCGLSLPRGVNAARNVRKRAEAELLGGGRESSS